MKKNTNFIKKNVKNLNYKCQYYAYSCISMCFKYVNIGKLHL